MASEHYKASSEDTRRAGAVWLSMAEMYGARWFRDHGLAPTDLWIAQVRRMNDTQIRLCLQGLIDSGSPHPPTLGEFVKAGQPETGSPRYLGADPIHMTELRRTGQLPREEKQVRDINELREKLK